jgi:hypothetical protein
MRDMKNKVLNVLGAVGSFGLAVGLMNGSVQEVVSFADPLNEMVMCVAALMMGSLFMIVLFSKEK